MSQPAVLQLWGRANSVNVCKVLWCLAELDLPFERIDAGMQFGRNQEPEYLRMNPNGKVPTLVDGDYVLWESNAIIRYLALEYGAQTSLYPAAARVRGGIERWLDWVLTTLQVPERTLFWGLIRTPPEQRDMPALQVAANETAALWQFVDAHLASRQYMEGDTFTLADLVLGCYARRWYGLTGVRQPAFAHVARWYQLVSRRPGFQSFLAPPLT